MMQSVTLETKCWEGDYRKILAPGRLQALAETNMYLFAERWLMINNVRSYARVCRMAEAAVRERVLTKYIIVEEHARAALEFFEIDRASFGRGYVYSISELVSLYLCTSDYLLHFAGDCHPNAVCDWLPQTVDFLGVHPEVKVANLSWICPHSPPVSEAEKITEDFYIGYGFSDQCYFVRTAEFRQPIYNEQNPASARYPVYGGELFEKRVDAWMRNHGHLRATYRHGAYRHEGHPVSAARRIRSIVGQVKARLRGSISTAGIPVFAPGTIPASQEAASRR
jgi:hypothetical protein